MITPRRTRLLRVPDLRAFRRTIVALCQPVPPNAVPVVVVPTRAAAAQLARLLEASGRAPADLVTRDELYDRLHGRLADPPKRLSALERDVIAQASARAVAAGGAEPWFQLRAGLVSEMLRFYDQLRRQAQPVKRFEELIDDALGGAREDDGDRGAARMRQQTRFLVEVYREYERRVQATGACDEHGLRDRLIAEPSANPVRRIVVTVPDWIADADGLFVADFDLLARIPGLEALDIVCTEAVLGSGFHERLHSWWPGLDEEDVPRDPAAPRAVLIAPPGAPPEEPWWTFRDREEELVAVARRLDARRRSGDAAPLARTAVVFKRPLPYLYLAAEVFGAAGTPYRTSDTLPLAIEPAAAAHDLVLEAVGSTFARTAIVALLRSPHFSLSADGSPLPLDAVAALDRALSEGRYLGELDRLEALAAEWSGAAATSVRGRSLPALEAAVSAARELAPLAAPAPASAQIGRLLEFWSGHSCVLADEDPFAARERRARSAIANALAELAAVQAAQDDPPWAIEALASAVRRLIEEQTFAVASAADGVQLLDDRAARYGDFDEVAIVGLTDEDWPERPRRNIFYPPSVLKSLGWPSERDRHAAAEARFLEILATASGRTVVSTVTLDDDALVPRSMLLDEIPRARLSTVGAEPFEPSRVFIDEALSLDPVDLTRLPPDAAAWAELRLARSPAEAPAFHGTAAGAGQRDEGWSVSALETYLDCPFKFFARYVLALDEEPEDEEVMDPRRQGQFMHAVFEEFFKAWQDAGGGAVTPANLDGARALFAEVVERKLGELPPAEAALERTRLLGSPAASGLGEAVLRMEAERPIAVVERLLEHRLNGPFTIATAAGERTVALHGKADRIDLLADGTFRLVDYKLGWPPNRKRSLQLPIYSLCAEQRLAGHRGRRWTLGEAAYLAFKGPRRVVPLFTADGDRAKALAEAQQQLADTLDAIGRGEFPPRPDDVYRCEACAFAGVCRKDYVGDV